MALKFKFRGKIGQLTPKFTPFYSKRVRFAECFGGSSAKMKTFPLEDSYMLRYNYLKTHNQKI
jgi:hypothetical protein